MGEHTARTFDHGISLWFCICDHPPGLQCLCGYSVLWSTCTRTRTRRRSMYSTPYNTCIFLIDSGPLWLLYGSPCSPVPLFQTPLSLSLSSSLPPLLYCAVTILYLVCLYPGIPPPTNYLTIVTTRSKSPPSSSFASTGGRRSPLPVSTTCFCSTHSRLSRVPFSFSVLRSPAFLVCAFLTSNVMIFLSVLPLTGGGYVLQVIRPLPLG
jgi:hypothetical protein